MIRKFSSLIETWFSVHDETRDPGRTYLASVLDDTDLIRRANRIGPMAIGRLNEPIVELE